MMPDDPKVVSLRPPRKPERALCTGSVPSDNLRNVIHVPADLVDDEVLARLGLNPGAWPPAELTTVVPTQVLRELRDRARSAAIADAEAEKALLQSIGFLERTVRMVHLSRVENETIARRLTELAGDDETPPPGAA